jgi:hypothetical protein
MNECLGLFTCTRYNRLHKMTLLRAADTWHLTTIIVRGENCPHA